MFRAIVGAILFIELGIPLILRIISALFDSSIGCRIFGIVIILVIVILA